MDMLLLRRNLHLCCILLLLFGGFFIFPNLLDSFDLETMFTAYPSFTILNETIPYPGKLSLAQNHSRIILAWTTFFGADFLKDTSCPAELNCRFTSDRSEISNAAAVVFHIPDMSRWDLPRINRHKWQRYVFYIVEPPPETKFFHLLNLPPGFFNYTMTYRLDSDILDAYGRLSSGRMLVSDSNGSLPQSVIEAGKTKTKLVLWIASNCNTPSNREDIVKEMQQYLEVDIWGKCGNVDGCPHAQNELCHKRLDQEYKFHLAFENSICKHYVSEKFWGRIRLNSVPIVLRREILQELGIPDSAYMAVDDFPSVKDLTDRILYLDKNLTAYLEYFKWKFENIEVNESETKVYSGMCGLCEKLRDSTAPVKFYSNIAQWWYTESQCQS